MDPSTSLASGDKRDCSPDFTLAIKPFEHSLKLEERPRFETFMPVKDMQAGVATTMKKVKLRLS